MGRSLKKVGKKKGGGGGKGLHDQGPQGSEKSTEKIIASPKKIPREVEAVDPVCGGLLKK